MKEEVSTIHGPRASTSIRRCSMQSSKTKEARVEFWPPFKPSSLSTFSSYRNKSCLISTRCSVITSLPQQSLISCSMRLRVTLQALSNLSCRKEADGASVAVVELVDVYSRVSARNRPFSGVKISVGASSLPSSATSAHSWTNRDPASSPSSTPLCSQRELNRWKQTSTTRSRLSTSMDMQAKNLSIRCL